MKKVFVSGCFDLLHSGHIEFLREAAQFGELYVGIGSDKTVYNLKGRKTINTEQERLFMVKSIRYVTDAWINSGQGLMDFSPELIKLKPDILFVNDDGHSVEKEMLCRECNMEYIIRNRIPHNGLPSRSTTELREVCTIPYRIDLAGGWLDQPYVSTHHPGSVITISIEPDIHFNERSGMATSTRRKAVELWNQAVPEGDSERLAKILFSYENPPGTTEVSGSQDAIGIVYPGVNRLEYRQNEYWRSGIHSIYDEGVLKWLEDHLSLLSIQPREKGFRVLGQTNINSKDAKDLADAAQCLWLAALRCDSKAFGIALKDSFESQIAMFPLMMNDQVKDTIETVKSSCLGYKLSGAGGGGYLVIFSEIPIPGTIRIRIRRSKN